MTQPKTYQLANLFHTSWEKLTPSQHWMAIEYTDQMLHTEKGSKRYGMLLIQLLRTLRKNKKLVSNIEVDQAVDCFNALDFLKRNDRGSFLIPWYHFPKVTNKLSTPSRSTPPLYYHTFEQLCYADSHFSAFCLLNYQYNRASAKRKEELLADMNDALNYLIAVIYIKPEDFTTQEMDKVAAYVKQRCPEIMRTLVLHTYANVRQYITDRCPTLFPKPLVVDENQTEEQPQHTGPMWQNLRYDLAKTEVFKGFNVASHARIYDALDFLEKEAIEVNQKRPPNGQA